MVRDHPSHFRRHMLIMVLCCLIPVAAIVAIRLFSVPTSSVVTFALFLLCPLSHVLMMTFMGKERRQPAAGDAPALDAKRADTSSSRGAPCH